jgi:hypothetical protein
LRVEVKLMLNIIFGNDFYWDTDGWAAYIWLHHAQDLGLCKILAVTTCSDDHLRESESAFGDTLACQLDYVRRWYHHDPVPIGLPYADAADTWRTLLTTAAINAVAAKVPMAHGQDSNDVYGNALASAMDGSVTLMNTGPFIGLVQFMRTADLPDPPKWGGLNAKELIAVKVNEFWACAGYYPMGHVDINNTNFGCPYGTDVERRVVHRVASQYMLENWPENVPIILYGESANNNRINWPLKTVDGDHPYYLQPFSTPDTIEGWDVFRVLGLVLGHGGMHELSASGYPVITDQGAQSWVADDVDGVPRPGYPVMRYVTAAPSTPDENCWASYQLMQYPEITDTRGLRLGYDFTGGAYGAQISGSWEFVKDISGNGFHATAYGTTKPKYLRDGILTFADGSYIQRDAAATCNFDYKLFYLILDVYIPDATDAALKIITGATETHGNTTEGWSLGISGKKWRFNKYSSVKVAQEELLSIHDITAGWHRVCIANHQTNNGTEWKMSLYVDGALEGDRLAPAQGNAQGYLRINGGAWPGAVAANFPIANYRMYFGRQISAVELLTRWMGHRPFVSRTDVRRGVDRGDGILGVMPDAYNL